MKSSPDPLGQISLMLWEALVLLMIEKKILQKDDVINVVSGVTEIVEGLPEMRSGSKDTLKSLRLLHAIAGSLSAAV